MSDALFENTKTHEPLAARMRPRNLDEYIGLAMSWKDEQPDTAKVFYELSLEEMGHVDKLHADVARQINEYRQKTGEPPKEMLALYNYLHEQHIAKAMQIKVKQGMFNG